MACSNLLILLSAHGEFLRRILSSPTLDYLVIEGLSVICRLAKRDCLHRDVPVWDAIAVDSLWKVLNLPRRQAPVRIATHRHRGLSSMRALFALLTRYALL
jgi:hypothetical protein